MKPLLSVVMSLHNEGESLRNALEAILAQSFQEFEVIVIDDASTDKSREILYSLAKENFKIRLFCASKRQGKARAYNLGLKEARGEYCVFTSPRDWILPGFFEKSLSLLLSHPYVGLCVSDHGYFFHEDEIVRSRKLHPEIVSPQAFKDEETIQLFKTSAFWVPLHASVVQKKPLIQLGGFHSELGFLSEWYALHATALKCGLSYLPGVLSATRMDSDALPQKNKKETYQYLMRHLTKQKELRGRFAESTLLRPMVKRLLPQLLFNPFEWDLLVPLIQKKLL